MTQARVKPRASSCPPDAPWELRDRLSGPENVRPLLRSWVSLASSQLWRISFCRSWAVSAAAMPQEKALSEGEKALIILTLVLPMLEFVCQKFLVLCRANQASEVIPIPAFLFPVDPVMEERGERKMPSKWKGGAGCRAHMCWVPSLL